MEALLIIGILIILFFVYVKLNKNSCHKSGTCSTFCSSVCGEGKKTQKRLCNNPEPGPGGNPCEGTDTQVVACTSGECVNGGWGNWFDYIAENTPFYIKAPNGSQLQLSSLNVKVAGAGTKGTKFSVKYAAVDTGEVQLYAIEDTAGPLSPPALLYSTPKQGTTTADDKYLAKDVAPGKSISKMYIKLLDPSLNTFTLQCGTDFLTLNSAGTYPFFMPPTTQKQGDIFKIVFA
jgi:hypothetical protein